MKRWRASALVAIALSCACQTLLDFKPSEDGDDDNRADAQSPPPPTPLADGAGDDVVDAALPCVGGQAAAFCDDFDQAGLAELWTIPAPPVGDSPVTTDAAASSPPNSMSARPSNGLPVFVRKRLSVPSDGGGAFSLRYVASLIEFDAAGPAPLVTEVRFIDAQERVTARLRVFLTNGQGFAVATDDRDASISSFNIPLEAWDVVQLHAFFEQAGEAGVMFFGASPLRLSIPPPAYVEFEVGVRNETAAHVLFDSLAAHFRRRAD